MQDGSPRVAIIGAGLAGLTLALELKKQGITATIYEIRSADYEHMGGNIALAPNGARIMDDVGALELFRPDGFVYETMTIANGTGRVLGAALNGSVQLYGLPAIRVPRRLIRKALLARVVQEGIEIHYGKGSVGISEDSAKGVKVAFNGGDVAEADYVVGCDGIHSSVRPHLAKDATPRYTGAMGVGSGIMRDQLGHGLIDRLPMPVMLFGRSGFFAVMPSNSKGDQLNFFSTLDHPLPANISPSGDEARRYFDALGADKARLHSMLVSRFDIPESPPLVRSLVTKSPAETILHWPQFAVPELPSWTSPSKRVIVIGDAAHAIPPTAGQGASMAFEDAASLALAIARGKSVIPAWEAHRRERVKKIVAITKASSLMRSNWGGVVGHWLRQLLMRFFLWSKGERGGMEWVYGYDIKQTTWLR